MCALSHPVRSGFARAFPGASRATRGRGGQAPGPVSFPLHSTGQCKALISPGEGVGKYTPSPGGRSTQRACTGGGQVGSPTTTCQVPGSTLSPSLQCTRLELPTSFGSGNKGTLGARAGRSCLTLGGDPGMFQRPTCLPDLELRKGQKCNPPVDS